MIVLEAKVEDFDRSYEYGGREVKGISIRIKKSCSGITSAGL